MPQYLGHLGGMVPIHAAASLSTSDERPMSFRTTLGGVRKVQYGQRTHRKWSVSFPPATAPEQAATLAAFVAGEFGTGPWWWVDSWAQVTNLCSARGGALEVGALAGVSLAGAVDLGDGHYAGRHLITGGATVDLPHVKGAPELVPVLPGRAVTVSAWVDGGTVSAVFRNAAGAMVSNPAGQSASGSGWQRVAATAVPPATAAAVQVRVTGANRVTRPAITWTPHLLGYHAGQGAPKAVVGPAAQDVRWAATNPGQQYAAVSFTIEEVG